MTKNITYVTDENKTDKYKVTEEDKRKLEARRAIEDHEERKRLNEEFGFNYGVMK